MYSKVIRTFRYAGIRLYRINLLGLSAFFCSLLLIARVASTSIWQYGFLFWNLFLALSPLLLVNLIARWPVIWENKLSRVLVFMCWLLLLPNSFYLVTDLLHLSEYRNIPRWFDLVMLFSFAWTGLLGGVLAMSRMECLVRASFLTVNTVVFRLVLIVLMAFGVYLGRHLRFNSWDFFMQPDSLIWELLLLFRRPFAQGEAWLTIGLYAILFLIIYRSLLPLIIREFSTRSRPYPPAAINKTSITTINLSHED